MPPRLPLNPQMQTPDVREFARQLQHSIPMIARLARALELRTPRAFVLADLLKRYRISEDDLRGIIKRKGFDFGGRGRPLRVPINRLHELDSAVDEWDAFRTAERIAKGDREVTS